LINYTGEHVPVACIVAMLSFGAAAFFWTEHVREAKLDEAKAARAAEQARAEAANLKSDPFADLEAAAKTRSQTP
jgi:hypothetical protein